MNGPTTHEEAVEQARGADLSPAMLERASKPKKTWFFERIGDGMIFACEAREAWEIVYNKSTWKRRDFRLVGTSDGTTYHRIAKESMSRATQLEPQINALKEELSRYMRAEERLIENEAVDMEGDPGDTQNEENKKKILRLRTMQERIHEKLDVIEAEYRSMVKDVVSRATAAELEVAKKNQQARIDAGQQLDWPDKSENIYTPDASPDTRAKILGVLGGRKS